MLCSSGALAHRSSDVFTVRRFIAQTLDSADVTAPGAPLRLGALLFRRFLALTLRCLGALQLSALTLRSFTIMSFEDVGYSTWALTVLTLCGCDALPLDTLPLRLSVAPTLRSGAPLPAALQLRRLPL